MKATLVTPLLLATLAAGAVHERQYATACETQENTCRTGSRTGSGVNQSFCSAQRAACDSYCNTQENACRTAANANQAFCSAQRAGCLASTTSSTPATSVAPSSTVLSSIIVYTSTTTTPSASPSPTGPVIITACQTQENACRTAPGANQAFCSAQRAACDNFCNAQENACRTAPGANQAFCSAQRARCIALPGSGTVTSTITPIGTGSVTTYPIGTGTGVGPRPSGTVYPPIPPYRGAAASVSAGGLSAVAVAAVAVAAAWGF